MNVVICRRGHESEFDGPTSENLGDSPEEIPEVGRCRGIAEINRSAGEVKGGRRTPDGGGVFFWGSPVRGNDKGEPIATPDVVQGNQQLVVQEVGVAEFFPPEISEGGDLFSSGHSSSRRSQSSPPSVR